MGLRKAACEGLWLGRERGRLTSLRSQAENLPRRLRGEPLSVCVLPEVLFGASHFFLFFDSEFGVFSALGWDQDVSRL